MNQSWSVSQRPYAVLAHSQVWSQLQKVTEVKQEVGEELKSIDQPLYPEFSLSGSSAAIAPPPRRPRWHVVFPRISKSRYDLLYFRLAYPCILTYDSYPSDQSHSSYHKHVNPKLREPANQRQRRAGHDFAFLDMNTRYEHVSDISI